jgi:beta-lactamase regulating signal transducer with metallopeptidase domain
MSYEILSTVGAWLLTYMVHSTVLLVAAWIVAHLLGSRRLAWQEMLWRGALLGGLVTATAQLGLAVHPFAGTLELAESRPPAATSAAPAPGRAGASYGMMTAISPEPIPSLTAVTGTAPATFGQVTQESERAPDRPSASSWPLLLLSLWLVGALIGLVRLAVSARTLRVLLARQRRLASARVQALVQRLSGTMNLRRAVTVSTCPDISTPFATGLTRPAVYLPQAVEQRLSLSQQESLLAHELAHIARHDPLWILVYRVIESVLFFQPLNRIARRRLLEIGECLCDDSAVRCTGKRLDLAQCLVEVAQWLIPGRQPLLLASALPDRSEIGARIRRLLVVQRLDLVRARWIIPGMVLLLTAVTLCLPTISLTATSVADAAMATPVAGPVPRIMVSELDLAELDSEPEETPKPEAAEKPEKPEKPDAPVLSEEERRARLAEVMARVEQLSQLNEERAAAIAARVAVRSEDIERRIAELVAERVQLSEEQQARLARQAETIAAEIKEQIRQREHVLRALRERAEALSEELDPDHEEVRRLHAEARALAEDLRPSGEALRELREQLRDELRPLREQLRNELRPLQEELRDELRQLREEELRPLREELRDETRQLREELRALIEESRRLAREARQQTDG